MRELEAAGTGDVSALTPIELSQWLDQHPETQNLVDQINRQCQPLRVRADASWSMRTAEGRICYVAQIRATPPVYSANPKGY